MASWIQSKPIEAIDWADLQSLIKDQVSEGLQIEFKKEIPGKNGQPDPWTRGDKMADFGRDKICAELCAFLNAYGGTLFLGVDESRDHPRHAINLTPIPRALELAKRFEDVVRSHIDPPPAGLAVHAVLAPGGGDGAGVLIFRATPSTVAPHGFGTPPQAYTRRGSSSDPMSMQDLQSMFWEARTKAERIMLKRKAFDDYRLRLYNEPAADSDVLRAHAGAMNLIGQEPGISFRVSAIPQQKGELIDVFEFSRPQFGEALRPSVSSFAQSLMDFPDSRYPPNGWQLRANGIFSHEIRENRFRSFMHIDDQGSVSISTLFLGQRSDHNQQFRVFPIWLISPVIKVMYLAEQLRRLTKVPENPIELDIVIAPAGDIYTEGDGRFDHMHMVRPIDVSEIGPLVWRRRSDMQNVFSEALKQVYAGCGLPANPNIVPKFDRALDSFAAFFTPAP